MRQAGPVNDFPSSFLCLEFCLRKLAEAYGRKEIREPQ
jgi:hypothetical protein